MDVIKYLKQRVIRSYKKLQVNMLAYLKAWQHAFTKGKFKNLEIFNQDNQNLITKKRLI